MGARGLARASRDWLPRLSPRVSPVAKTVSKSPAPAHDRFGPPPTESAPPNGSRRKHGERKNPSVSLGFANFEESVKCSGAATLA